MTTRRPARLRLLGEFADNRIELSIHLCGKLYAAAADLLRISSRVDPADLYRRFVAWVPRSGLDR